MSQEIIGERAVVTIARDLSSEITCRSASDEKMHAFDDCDEAKNQDDELMGVFGATKEGWKLGGSTEASEDEKGGGGGEGSPPVVLTHSLTNRVTPFIRSAVTGQSVFHGPDLFARLGTAGRFGYKNAPTTEQLVTATSCCERQQEKVGSDEFDEDERSGSVRSASSRPLPGETETEKTFHDKSRVQNSRVDSKSRVGLLYSASVGQEVNQANSEMEAVSYLLTPLKEEEKSKTKRREGRNQIATAAFAGLFSPRSEYKGECVASTRSHTKDDDGDFDYDASLGPGLQLSERRPTHETESAEKSRQWKGRMLLSGLGTSVMQKATHLIKDFESVEPPARESEQRLFRILMWAALAPAILILWVPVLVAFLALWVLIVPVACVTPMALAVMFIGRQYFSNEKLRAAGSETQGLSCYRGGDQRATSSTIFTLVFTTVFHIGKHLAVIFLGVSLAVLLSLSAVPFLLTLPFTVAAFIPLIWSAPFLLLAITPFLTLSLVLTGGLVLLNSNVVRDWLADIQDLIAHQGLLCAI